VALAAALFGAVAGYSLFCAITLRMAELRLQEYASRLVADGEAASSAVRVVLRDVKESSYPLCSDAEIKHLRSLIFRSEYAKNVGRMEGDRILCSANSGRLDQPRVRPYPDFVHPDGTKIYRNIVGSQKGGVEVVALQQGDTYVAFFPMTQLRIEPAPLHFTETLRDASSQKVGRLLGENFAVGESLLMTNGQGWQGNQIYATRCSSRYYNCMTAFQSFHEALQISWKFYALSSGVGAVIAMLTGQLFCMIYLHSQSIEQQLRRAVGKEQLRVFYQPVVDLASGRTVGAEALSRWTNEDGVAVPADVFIQVAEEGGFIGEITRLVVRQVMRDFGSALQASPEFRININVTASDLSSPEFLPFLERSLDEAGVPALSLGIEITESCTARQQMVIEAVRLMHDKGHKVYIDDFGTGYSSLACLHDLSVDAIKIDRAFTRAIGTESVTVGILPQILAMAEALNLQVIVEGVENRQQADYFGGAKMPVGAQGWLFGYPIPVTEFQERMAQEKQETSGWNAKKRDTSRKGILRSAPGDRQRIDGARPPQ
jgi:sensor c-di-GMP phosphodiesterase-like protein